MRISDWSSYVCSSDLITKGAGVPVVYDGVGKDTWPASLDCLQPFGLMASFGSASGPVPPFDVNILAGRGSLYVTRPTLVTYTAKRADLVGSANALFDVVTSGKVDRKSVGRGKGGSVRLELGGCRNF